METAYRSEQEQNALSVNQVHGPSVKQFDYLKQMRPQLRERIPEIVAGRRGNLVQGEWNLKKKQEPSVWI